MRILRSLLMTLIVVSFSNAQERGERSVSEEATESELEATTISEPTASEIAASSGDQKSLTALEAVKEGNDLWRSGDLELSAVSYQRAVNLDPSLYSAHFNLGLTLLHTKEYRRAVFAFTEALRLRPQSASAWQSLGYAHYYGKHYQKAVEAFREAQRLAPEQVVTNSNLGFAYLFVGRLQDAITSFQIALQLDSGFGPAINGLCSAQALAKNAGNAVEACLRATNNEPESAGPQYFLGLAYMDLGQTEKGLSALQEAARIEPRTARIYVGLGFGCFKLKKYQEALYHFEYARKLDLKAKHALLGLGITYAKLKNYDKAEKVLREAVSSNPDNPFVQFNLGIVCLARGNRDCALSQYNRLQIMDHSLARTLFTTMFRDRVVDATTYKP
jgi:tetratricopeptide (TPR) repeat protein